MEGHDILSMALKSDDEIEEPEPEEEEEEEEEPEEEEEEEEDENKKEEEANNDDSFFAYYRNQNRECCEEEEKSVHEEEYGENEDTTQPATNALSPLLDPCCDSSHFVGAGLKNLGNSCYMNSVLQCLTYTPPLVAHLRNTMHALPCATQGFCTFCSLRDHINRVLTSRDQVIEPTYLFDNVSNFSSSASFVKFSQEDAHEYMHCLLESLHISMLPSKTPEECLILQGESFVKSLFGGRLKNQIKCDNCSYSSEVFEPFLDLSLEIPNSDTIEEALEAFTAEESIERGDDCKCEECKQGGSMKKKVTIEKSPDILLIQLKRFVNNGYLGNKLLKTVDFSDVLDLTHFSSEDIEAQELKFELYAVIIHSGLTLQYGHYYCVVQTSPGIWHKLNDAAVNCVDKEYVLKQDAYILCYYRKGSCWPFQSLEATNFALADSPKSVLENSHVTDESEFSEKEAVKDKMLIDDNDKSNLLCCSNLRQSHVHEISSCSHRRENTEMATSSRFFDTKKVISSGWTENLESETEEPASWCRITEDNTTDENKKGTPVASKSSTNKYDTGSPEKPASPGQTIRNQFILTRKLSPQASKHPNKTVTNGASGPINRIMSSMPSNRRSSLLQCMPEQGQSCCTPKKKSSSLSSSNKRTSPESLNVPEPKKSRCASLCGPLTPKQKGFRDQTAKKKDNSEDNITECTQKDSDEEVSNPYGLEIIE